MKMNSVIMPGEIIPDSEFEDTKRKIILGPGIRKLNNDSAVACKAGILCSKNKNTFWIDSHQKRYIPVRGESVIGVVTQKAGDIYRVDIEAHELASLPYLAFEGANKKYRPDVSVGDLIYGRLSEANRDLEPEMVCVNSHGKKEKLGVLSDGFLFKCSLNLVRRILKEKCPLIRVLQREMPFEIAVGMNGRIWIKGKTVKETIALGNAILAAEHKSDNEISRICENIGNILFT